MCRPKTNDDDDDDVNASSAHHREGKERVVVDDDEVVADRSARATRSTARRILVGKGVLFLSLSLAKHDFKWGEND